MEGQSPNNNVPTAPSSIESRGSSDRPTSFRVMSTTSENSYNDMNLNVPNVSRSIRSNSIAGIGESSFSSDIYGDSGQYRITPDGSLMDNTASISNVDRERQVMLMHDILSQSPGSIGSSINQGQARPRGNTSNLVNTSEYGNWEGRLRRRQQNTTRSTAASNDTTRSGIPDGSFVDDRASISNVDRERQVMLMHDIFSRSPDSIGPSINQGQARPRGNTSNLVNTAENSNWEGRLRRRQHNITRSTTASNDMTLATNTPQIFIVDSSAQGSVSLAETNFVRVIESHRFEISNTSIADRSAILQRLRPTPRRAEMIGQALRSRVDAPGQQQNTQAVHFTNVLPPNSSTGEYHHGVGIPPPPPPPQPYIYNSEGINLAVVLNFDDVQEARPQNNQMLNLATNSDAAMAV
ncbi:hypothetical protein ACH5RR_018075 [Cinchona calisaya]|uniref:Uncharacterized protein n=1 Tax=Cinchona calisaya TaxID=153742 RepID=A0ABD2ZM31_9GENT